MNFERWEAYFAGELDTESMRQFETELGDDPQTWDSLSEQSKIDMALRIVYSGQADLTSEQFHQKVMESLHGDRETIEPLPDLPQLAGRNGSKARWPAFVRATVAIIFGKSPYST